MDITYRGPEPDDEAVMLAIYADSRREELQIAGWDESTLGTFVRMQFRARESAYQMQFPEMEDRLICVDGEVAGRVMVDRSDATVHLVDIAIKNEFRRRGISRFVVDGLKDEARGLGKALTLRVEQSNAAAAGLYRSLGLREVRTEGHLTEMQWSGDDDKR